MPFAQTTSARLLLLAAIMAAGLALYWPSVYKVAYGVLHRHGSSHGVFIPFLSAYFIYLKWDRLKSLPIYYWPPGAAAMLLLLFVPLVVRDSFELQFIAYVMFAAVAVLFCLGKQIAKSVLFPILFTLAMIPIPQGLYGAMADMTRHATFSVSLGVLSVFNIPFYREGWLIKLPNALLEVAISCSGIRYLISYFVFGLAYAYLFRKRNLSRAVLVAATIPISLAASSLRLTIIFLATYYISPRMAEYWPHVILSWVVFFVILFGLIFLDQHNLGRRNRPHDHGVATQYGH
ncbi:MAG: exosortase/archaeosortase family protein [Desulfosarcina sp.]|nr:exosortase/archaeosortase family protein [Desulfobacterales bacterium]